MRTELAASVQSADRVVMTLHAVTNSRAVMSPRAVMAGTGVIEGAGLVGTTGRRAAEAQERWVERSVTRGVISRIAELGNAARSGGRVHPALAGRSVLNARVIPSFRRVSMPVGWIDLCAPNFER